MIEQQYSTACSLIEAGKLEQAFDTLKAILEQDRQYYPAINKLGVIYANQKKHEAAKECFHQALEIKPDYAPAFVNLGNLHMEAGDYSYAIELYKRALENDADYCFAYYNLAIAYKKLGDYSKYVQFIKEYRKLHSKELKQHKQNFLQVLAKRKL